MISKIVRYFVSSKEERMTAPASYQGLVDQIHTLLPTACFQVMQKTNDVAWENLTECDYERFLVDSSWTTIELEIRSDESSDNPVSTSPSQHCLALVKDHRILFFTLESESFSVYSSAFFDLRSRVLVTSNGSVIVTGGERHPNQALKICLPGFRVTHFPGMITGRRTHAVVELRQEVVVIGGCSNTGPISTVESFKFGANWCPQPALHTARYACNAVVCGNQLVVIGGLTSKNGVSSLAETVEKLVEDRWIELPLSLPYLVISPGLIPVSATEIILAGGMKTIKNEADETYEILPESWDVRNSVRLNQGDVFPGNAWAIQDQKCVLMGIHGVHILSTENRVWRFLEYPTIVESA